MTPYGFGPACTSTPPTARWKALAVQVSTTLTPGPVAGLPQPAGAAGALTPYRAAASSAAMA